MLTKIKTLVTIDSNFNIQDVKEMILTDIVAKGKEAKLASFEQG